jgi:ferredoxin
VSAEPGARRPVWVDPAKCVGSATCVNVAPEVFEIDEAAGIAVVVSQDGAPAEDIDEAVSLCPAEAIAYGDPDVAVDSGAPN